MLCKVAPQEWAYLCTMKTNSSKLRREIVIAEINILRQYEHRELIQEKISREIGKLHSLWFKGNHVQIRDIFQ